MSFTAVELAAIQETVQLSIAKALHNHHFQSLSWPCHIMALVQYCAKVTQAKCANFILCLRELSRKVRTKVRVTIQGLLSEISLEQRTLFRQIFGMKRNFTMTSVVSLAQCPKFLVRQTQQFLTRSI